MRRREFIGAVVVAALAVAVMGSARAAERTSSHRIAVVVPLQPVAELTASGEPFWQVFFNEFRRLGYVEGNNLLIERYSGGGRAAHYPELARAIVSRNPDLIIAFTNILALDFKAATTTIPIVAIMAFPVEAGIVTSLSRPGGNITGTAVDVGQEQWGKRIQLLQQVSPQATRLGFLNTRAVRERYGPKEGEVTGGVTWVGQPLDPPMDEAVFRRVFTGLVQDRADAIVVSDELETWVKRKLIVELAEKYVLPAIYPFKEFVEAGGLMSYGVDTPALAHRIVDMADQILKGAKPSETPIYQPTKFELVINLKTAKALGLTVPATLLVAADDVIE